MGNANEQLVTAQMLHDAGWLDTAMQEWTGGTKTWGVITGNPKVLMTINGFKNLPCMFYTRQTDGTVTSHSGTTWPKGYKFKSDITDFNRLLRWKDFELDSSTTTESSEDFSTLIRRVEVGATSFYGWNVTNISKDTDGTCSADVQAVLTPPDGIDIAARETYYWQYQRMFKTATGASTPTALGPITFKGKFEKGSKGYMYSDFVPILMYGVQSIDYKTLEDSSDWISTFCWYEEAVKQ